MCRFRMLDMRWKALDRAVNLSWVPAQGDAAFLAFCVVKALRSATKPYLGSKTSRVAGRVIENPFVSVTIDVLIMRIPSCRASGSDWEECQRWEGW